MTKIFLWLARVLVGVKIEKKYECNLIYWSVYNAKEYAQVIDTEYYEKTKMIVITEYIDGPPPEDEEEDTLTVVKDTVLVLVRQRVKESGKRKTVYYWEWFE